jgi:hypothetical protein
MLEAGSHLNKNTTHHKGKKTIERMGNKLTDGALAYLQEKKKVVCMN